MKLEFLYVPTSDLDASLAFYRDGLGLSELWREGDTTVALAGPGSETAIMLDAGDPEAPAGPVFVVPSVADFHAARPAGLEAVSGPDEIPGGFWATYLEPGGSAVHILDQSTDASAG